VLDSPEAGWQPEDGSKDDVASFAASLLQRHSAMLHEYFQIQIDAAGNVAALPQLIPGYVPAMQLLPMFLLRLTTEVDWAAEAPCLEGVCRELAAFYSLRPGVASLLSHLPAHPDNVQTLGGSDNSPAAPDATGQAEGAAAAALDGEQHVNGQGCCRGTCGPRLEKGDEADAMAEVTEEALPEATAECDADSLVNDARARRQRLHWSVPCASAAAQLCSRRAQAAPARAATRHPNVHAAAREYGQRRQHRSGQHVLPASLSTRAPLLIWRRFRLHVPASCTKCSSAADSQLWRNKKMRLPYGATVVCSFVLIYSGNAMRGGDTQRRFAGEVR
jgi:hypothetical protein